LWLGILFEAGLGLLAFGVSWLFNEPIWRQVHCSTRDVALGILISVPMLLAFGVCVRWPIGPLARIKQFADEVVRPMFAPYAVWELALLSLAAGAGEELLFRGTVQAALAGWLGPHAGLALASILFGLMHPMTWAYAVLASVMGAYLGWAWITTGNLLVVIVAHAFYDCIALVFITRLRVSSFGGQPDR
jgi:membrane protease YdiL (CAAX protease family)